MKKVFTHRRLELVGLCQSILESEGILTLVKNEAVTHMEGAFFGEGGYPELWVMDDGDYERAMEVLRSHLPSGDT